MLPPGMGAEQEPAAELTAMSTLPAAEHEPESSVRALSTRRDASPSDSAVLRVESASV